MKSATAFSYELDDAQAAAMELAQEIQDKLTLQDNSLGIMFCDADVCGADIAGNLKNLLGIEVVGMATLATIDRTGHREGGILLLVLTAKDVVFTTAVSEAFSLNHEQQIVDTYQKLIPENIAEEERPSLLIAFCPSGVSFSGDMFPTVLSRISGHTPIIGGVASDDYDYKRAKVFSCEAEYASSLILIALWGSVKPVFSVRHVTSDFAERIHRVTKSVDNVVFRVGEESFVEYLRGFGLEVEVEDPTLSFISFPLQLTTEEKDEAPVMRHLASLNLEAGSGTFLGDVPQGALAKICLINREDLKVSAHESIHHLKEKMKGSPEYEYSTVLCVSCCGRAVLLGPESSAEGHILKTQTPEGLSLAGVYCLGEICPIHFEEGKAKNRFHNCSFTLCAF